MKAHAAPTPAINAFRAQSADQLPAISVPGANTKRHASCDPSIAAAKTEFAAAREAT
jgi:hypothetical protein